MMRHARAALRVLLSAIWVGIIFFPLYATWQLRASRINSRMMQFSFWVGAFLWGLRVRRVGRLADARPLLVVSNHTTYLDCFALGSAIPARFTPKKEISGWPVIGFVCRIGGCIFIDRRRTRVLHNRSELDHAVREKSVISLFPEGTTADGTALLPFHSSFFSLAETFDIPVQPVSVIYTHLSGRPLESSSRLTVAWVGDAPFSPHVWNVLAEKNVDVTLVFHEPVVPARFASRKHLAAYCRDVIEKTVLTAALLPAK